MHNAAISDNINMHGQHLFGIFPTEDGQEPAFFYTIGNALKGLPELLLVGNFPPNIASGILNDFGQKMREDNKPLVEGLVDIGWSFPFKVRNAGGDVRDRFTIQAGRFLDREDYDVQQIMVCDPEGKYPGDEGCDPKYDVVRP